MIKMTETAQSDVGQIREWLAADPWHKEDSRNAPELMITGNGLLSYCLQDDKGPLAYIKLTGDDGLVRIAMQFAPPDVVSKRRLTIGLARVGIPMIKIFAIQNGYKGIVYESTSPKLIAFCEKLGFRSVGNDDYAVLFGEDTHV